MSTGSLDVVVAGAGRVGLRTVRILREYGHSVTVVERDRDRCEEISDEYLATIVEGDATHPDTLRQANLDDADVLAALTGNQGANLGICVAGTRIAEGELRTVARIEDEGAESYREIVDDVVFPEELGAVGAANAAIGGDVRAFEEVAGDLRLLEVRVQEGAPAAGKTLSSVSLPRGSLVVSDEVADGIPRPEMELRPGHTYIIAAEPAVADEVLNLMQG
ncbi:potassium channel family protein [Halorussus ruber]|uniref:potassium channel family protein n=1 Tax=Halorussus ruber TaxID=1126238 RepID=UPI00109192E9|nr:TrkA family potassium uptake protein [Halorussus ruber]